MPHRIHRALDGELPADALTPQERAELQRYRAIVGTALEPIRQLPPINVTSAVMRRVAPGPGAILRALAAAAHWLWSPRPLTVRPAFALAGALAVAAVVSTPVLQTATPTNPAPARVIVQFRLGDVDAREVALGRLQRWRPSTGYTRCAGWSVDALEPGPTVFAEVHLTSIRSRPA
jgi:hypothetical protein